MAGKWIVSTTLTITDQYAGDNYVVAAAIETEPTVAMAIEEFNGGEGHVLVAWARKYYTVGETCKVGSVLKYNASANDTSLYVEDATPFAEDDHVLVFSCSSRLGEECVVSAVDHDEDRLDLAAPLAGAHLGGRYYIKGIPKGFVALLSGGRWQLPANLPSYLGPAYGTLANWQGVEPEAPGEQYNGGCFTDWRAVGGPMPLPYPNAPPLYGDTPDFGFWPYWDVFEDWWDWHPGGQEADHSLVAACEREDMADHRPRGLSRSDAGDPKHICFVFVGSCGEPPVFDAGKTAVHELGHFMGILEEDSDDHHPEQLAHPHDHEEYDPDPLADYGCLMDYLADQGNTYCEFCVDCLATVRAAGPR